MVNIKYAINSLNERSYNQKYQLCANLIKDGYLIHCTKASFNEFNPNFIKGGMRAKEGYGFYFTDMPYKAIDYGDNFKLIKKEDFNFLNSSDTINVNLFYNDDIDTQIEQLNNQLDYVRNNKEYDYIISEIDKLKELKDNYNDILSTFVKQAIKDGAKTYGNLEYLIRNPQTTIPLLNKTYINNGYDGYYTDGIYTIFNFEKLNQYLITDIDNVIQQHIHFNNESKIYNIVSESLNKLLFEWNNSNINYDCIEYIQWRQHIEDDYDEDEEGNSISVTLYDLEMYDNDGECSYFDNLTDEELLDLLDNFDGGEDIYESIVNDTKDKGYLEVKEFINTSPEDINDINSVIKIASKIWKIVDYVPNSRGYILPNGMLLYFGPNVDHMSISYIEGMTIGRFIQIGAIRCGNNSFELACPPTFEQKRSLYKLIGGSNSNDVYVDICKYDLNQPISKNSHQMEMYPETICSANYNTNNPKLVLNQIDNYFQNGIKIGISNSMSLRAENKQYNKIFNILEKTLNKFLIKEMVSPTIWHFTPLKQLGQILDSNKLRFTRSYANHNEMPGITGFSEKHPYYFCTTRSRTSYDGYSRTLLDDNDYGYARIELDGDKLNNIVHSKASDYFGNREFDEDGYGKRNFYNKIENGYSKTFYNNVQDFYKDSEDNKSNEKEDTLWYNKEYLDNANKFIKRIDIVYFNENAKKLIPYIKESAKRINVPVFFYNNVKDFDRQK